MHESENFVDKNITLTNNHLYFLKRYNLIPKHSQLILHNNMDLIFDEIVYNEKLDLYAIKSHTVDNKTFLIKPIYITSICGMSVYRFILSCNITEDGLLSEALIEVKTDALRNIKGKKEYTIDNIKLYNGQKIIFHNDVNPEIKNQTFVVNGCGSDEGIYFTMNRGRKRTAYGAFYE